MSKDVWVTGVQTFANGGVPEQGSLEYGFFAQKELVMKDFLRRIADEGQNHKAVGLTEGHLLTESTLAQMVAEMGDAYDLTLELGDPSSKEVRLSRFDDDKKTVVEFPVELKGLGAPVMMILGEPAE